MTNQKISNEVLNTKIDDLKEDITEIKRMLSEDYVTRTEFDPVKKIVYGLVGITLTIVFGALITLIIRK